MPKNKKKQIIVQPSLSQRQHDFPLLADSLFTPYDAKDDKATHWIATQYKIEAKLLDYTYTSSHTTPYWQQITLLLTGLHTLLTQLSTEFKENSPWARNALGFLAVDKQYKNTKEGLSDTFIARLQKPGDFVFLNDQAMVQFYRDVKKQLELALYTWTQRLETASTTSRATVGKKILANFEILNRQLTQCVDGINGYLITLADECRDESDFMARIDAFKSEILADVALHASQIIQFFNPEADSDMKLRPGKSWGGWEGWQVHVETMVNSIAHELKLGVKHVAESGYSNVDHIKNRVLFTEQQVRLLLYPMFQQRFTVDNICQREAERLTKTYWQKFCDIIAEFSAIPDLTAKPKSDNLDEKNTKTPSFEQLLLQRMQLFIELGFWQVENIIIEKTTKEGTKKYLNQELQALVKQPEKTKNKLFTLLLLQVEQNCLLQGHLTKSVSQVVSDAIKMIKCSDAKMTVSKQLDEEGETALTLAIKQGELLIVIHLLQQGIDPNIPNEQGETPVELVIRNHKSEWELKKETSQKCPILLQTSPHFSKLQALIPVQYVTQDIDHFLQDVLLELLLSQPTIKILVNKSGLRNVLIPAVASNFSYHTFDYLIKQMGKIPYAQLTKDSKNYFSNLLVNLLPREKSSNTWIKKIITLLENISFSQAQLNYIKSHVVKKSAEYKRFHRLVNFSNIFLKKENPNFTLLIKDFFSVLQKEKQISFKQLITICQRQMSEKNFDKLLILLTKELKEPEQLIWLKTQYPALEINQAIALTKEKKPITLLGYVLKQHDHEAINALLASSIDALSAIDSTKTTPLMLVAKPEYPPELFALICSSVNKQCHTGKDEKDEKLAKYLVGQNEEKSNVFHYLLAEEDDKFEEQAKKLLTILKTVSYDWSNPPIKSDNLAISKASEDNESAKIITLLIMLAAAKETSDYQAVHKHFLTISAGSITDYQTLLVMIDKQCAKQSRVFFSLLETQGAPLACLLALQAGDYLRLKIDTQYTIHHRGKILTNTLIFSAFQLGAKESAVELLSYFSKQAEPAKFISEIQRSLIAVMQTSTAAQEDLLKLLLNYMKPRELLLLTDKSTGNLSLHLAMGSGCQFASFKHIVQIYLADAKSDKTQDEEKDKKINLSKSTPHDAWYQRNTAGETPLSLLINSDQTQKFHYLLTNCKLDLSSKPTLDKDHANSVLCYMLDAINHERWTDARRLCLTYSKLTEPDINLQDVIIPAELIDIISKQCKEQSLALFQEWSKKFQTIHLALLKNDWQPFLSLSQTLPVFDFLQNLDIDFTSHPFSEVYEIILSRWHSLTSDSRRLGPTTTTVLSTTTTATTAIPTITTTKPFSPSLFPSVPYSVISEETKVLIKPIAIATSASLSVKQVATVSELCHKIIVGIASDKEIIKDIKRLQHNGIDLNSRDEKIKATPLGLAITFILPDLVQALLNAGADPNLATGLPGKEHRSPLMVAVAKGTPSEFGSRYTIPASTRGPKKDINYKSLRFEMIKALVLHPEIDLNRKDEKQKTVLDWLKELKCAEKDKEVYEIILSGCASATRCRC